MSALRVDFPDQWAVLPTADTGGAAIERLVDGLGELGEDAQDAMGTYFRAVLPALSAVGVDGFASLALADDESGHLVQAFCAIGVEPGPVTDERLRSIVEGGLHPDLERETSAVDLPVGPAIRSSAFRWADELVDSDGVAPYAAEVRFTFPLGGDRIGVLHFETVSLVYLEELTELFDAIAGTAWLD
jgi:hypothetical protein